MNFKNFAAFSVLTLCFAVRADDTATSATQAAAAQVVAAPAKEKEIRWDSIEHKGPRGDSKIVLAGIGTLAAISAIAGFAYVLHKAGVLQKWYQYIKKHPFKSAAAVTAIIAITAAVIKKGPMLLPAAKPEPKPADAK